MFFLLEAIPNANFYESIATSIQFSHAVERFSNRQPQRSEIKCHDVFAKMLAIFVFVIPKVSPPQIQPQIYAHPFGVYIGELTAWHKR